MSFYNLPSRAAALAACSPRGQLRTPYAAGWWLDFVESDHEAPSEGIGVSFFGFCLVWFLLFFAFVCVLPQPRVFHVLVYFVHLRLFPAWFFCAGQASVSVPGGTLCDRHARVWRLLFPHYIGIFPPRVAGALSGYCLRWDAPSELWEPVFSSVEQALGFSFAVSPPPFEQLCHGRCCSCAVQAPHSSWDGLVIASKMWRMVMRLEPLGMEKPMLCFDSLLSCLDIMAVSSSRDYISVTISAVSEIVYLVGCLLPCYVYPFWFWKHQAMSSEGRSCRVLLQTPSLA